MAEIPYNTVLTAYQQLFPGADLSSPDGQSRFNDFWGSANALPPGVFDAALGVLSKPDQRKAFAEDYGGDMAKWLDSFTGWWGANGHTVADKLNQFGPEMALIDALGYKVNPTATPAIGGAGGGPVPLEQHLLNKIVTDYVGPDMGDDAKRKADAAAIVANINRSLEGAIALNQKTVDGTRLTEELGQADDTASRLAASAAAAAQTRIAALDQRKAEMTASLERMSTDRSGALDGETAQLRAGLAQLETERTAALEQLNTARLGAAEGQVTAINQGLQSERDRITAAAAQQGFVGGSTMQDGEMARATIGARSGAAQAIGGAKVANATDSRALSDDISGQRFAITGHDATERRGITDSTAKGRFDLDDAISGARVGVNNRLADDTQNASNTGTQMRASYFDNDFGRRIQAALMPASIGAQQLNLIDVPGQLGQAGVKRSLDLLNWFATGGTPPTSTPTNTAASTVGTGIAGLGAGIASAGFSAAKGIDWSKMFKSSTPAAKPAVLDPND